jgi:hypothetical protein
MSTTEAKPGRLHAISSSVSRHRTHLPSGESDKLRKPVSSRKISVGNRYVCALERNQNGKYIVRIRAFFSASGADRSSGKPSTERRNGAGWMVSVYYLASSFNAAMKKLEQALQSLQKNEDRLRFWGVERTDDPNVAAELLQEFGLRLDRRRDYPRKLAELQIASERSIPASMLAPVRRVLADSVSQERPVGQTALAGD